MATLEAGAAAPQVHGVDFTAGPTVVWFYKVTCPVCQMTAPVAQTLADGRSDRFVGIGQDPREKLDAFARTHGLGFHSLSEPPPYRLSNAYGIMVVPTMFLVGNDGMIVDSVVSWDRPGYDRVNERLAELAGSEPADLREVTASLPVFRPG